MSAQRSNELQRSTASGSATPDPLEKWNSLGSIPMRVAICVPLAKLSMRELTNLKPGQILHTSWPVADDVPVRAGEVLFSWAEFEDVDGRMAARITQFA